MCPLLQDFFISHTQRNPRAVAIAEKLRATLKETHGKESWLDVHMDNKSAAAMKEGVESSSCVIAIITGWTVELDDDDDHSKGKKNAYFARAYCLQELRWARDAGVMIQPVILMEDKQRIGEFLASAPEDLKYLGNIDFIELKRNDREFWEVGLNKIVRSVNRRAGSLQHGHGR